ncbi:NAD-dependent epimerase/dehydratase family protein [Euzebya tangerina]|uniref:NAD-dependent epimerase/dehydratase family protein n=1 Tax=Euzebya tangerina TaxID=591198 RepID=UPI000E30E3BC|nr:NAD-dependent epimerase/dehydratase family protein [Euzebya tangerina]
MEHTSSVDPQGWRNRISPGPWLVTGAAGFIGFHLAQRLLAEGIEVIGVDALNTYYDPALKQGRLAKLQQDPNFSFHRMDCANAEAMGLLAAQRRPRVIIHMAAQAGVRYSLHNPAAYVHSNLTGFATVLEVARRGDVEHLVYASSSSVYGTTGRLPFDVHDPADHPVSLYAATKRSNELMAHSYSHLFQLPTTGLRFFTVYGPWGRPDMAYYAFASAIMSGRPLTLYGDGSVVRDFTYVDDIVEGVVRVAGNPTGPNQAWTAEDPDPATAPGPFRLFNIGHGGQATIRELIELLEHLIGTKAVINYQPAADGDVPITRARTDELIQVTGFRPDTELEEGMSHFVDWLAAFRSQQSHTSSE